MVAAKATREKATQSRCSSGVKESSGGETKVEYKM
jgi:hypothetical protein